jgi:hypothetical protein
VASGCPRAVGLGFAGGIVPRFLSQDNKSIDGSGWIGNAITQGLFESGVDSFDKNYSYVYVLILIIYSFFNTDMPIF